MYAAGEFFFFMPISLSAYIYNTMIGIADFHNDILTAKKSAGLAALSAETEACVCAVFGANRSFGAVAKTVQKFFREKKPNLYLSLEDAHYLCESNIAEVCSWRPVCVSLTWNGANALAGGCMAEGGLTRLGKKMAGMLAASGIAIDCAHLNERSFSDVLETGAPVVDSHTCLYALRKHPRNLKDRQIRMIAERGGLVGIAFVGRFLGAKGADGRTVFEHFDHGIQKFGIAPFCFGTDFNGTEDLPHGLKTYKEAETLADIFLQNGYDTAAVEKIFRGNLIQFLTKKA